MTMEWLPFTQYPELQANEVHLFRLVFFEHREKINDYFSILNPEEQARAKRFHFEKDHDVFVITRATLRILLSHYFDTSPEQVTFSQNEHGKPFCQGAAIHFNVSHADEVAVIAVASGCPVGVDVENSSRELDYVELAERFFAQDEYSILKNLTGDALRIAFFNVWTRKEAFIKAVGEGLSYPLDEFVVSVLPEERACVKDVRGSVKKAKEWSIQCFTALKDYPVALVLQRDTKPKTHLWQH